MDAVAKRLDVLIRCPPPHADNDAAAHDRVRQPTEAGECDGGIALDFLGLDDLAAHYAAPERRAAPVPAVDEGADVLVLFCLCAKQGVYLVKQHGRRAVILITAPSEQIW